MCIRDRDRAGRLTLAQFSKLIRRLADLSGDDQPSYAIIKDLFELIDLKRDGKIDLNEWLATFKEVEAATGPKKKPNEDQQRKTSEFESSKEFDRVMRVFGKNRKFLEGAFREMRSQSAEFSFERVRAVLADVLWKEYIELTGEQWSSLLRFAEKEGFINTKLMLEVFKDRLAQIQALPGGR
eukprot:TRINITY_DN19954_c0_g1_i2.p1 TRINITY_DN19954_c0_g1~~TRINITY_DN19954_c0_g1_i2.p1  ORF type:complete len:182 (-),score=56.51 TRINITY_DN19954_c0_g1_i2:519-1064(-)